MLQAILKGISLGLLLAISVGPIVFTVIKQSLDNGKKGGFAFIAGIFISDVILVVCSNAFTEFFSQLKLYKDEIAGAGSILLIALGIYFFFFKKFDADQKAGRIINFNKRDYVKAFFTGMVINFLNPGILVFWFSTATAFSGHSISQRFVIFGVALLLALSADIAKVALANALRKKLTPKNIHRINRINGLILLGFGVALGAGLFFYKHTH